MPAIDFTYDPGMSLPANKITSEEAVVDRAVDVSVWFQHGPAFHEGLVVRGEVNNSGSFATLRPYIDYTFSPMFAGAMAASGRMISSYIIINLADVTTVSIDYHALGAHDDDRLISEVTALGSGLDRSSVLSWSQVKGSHKAFGKITRNPALTDSSLLEVLVDYLDRLETTMANPYSATAGHASKLTSIESRLSQIPTTSELESFQIAPSADVDIQADTVTELLTVNFPATSVIMAVNYQNAGETEEEQFMVNIVGLSGTPSIVPWAINGTTADLTTSITAVRDSGNIKISARNATAGNVRVRLLARF